MDDRFFRFKIVEKYSRSIHNLCRSFLYSRLLHIFHRVQRSI